MDADAKTMVVETAAAAPSSGSYLFFAAADAVSKALHHKPFHSPITITKSMLCTAGEG